MWAFLFCFFFSLRILYWCFPQISRVFNSPVSLHLPIFDLPSILTFNSWGMKEGLGRVNGGSSSDFSTFRPSGADHLRFLPPDGLLEPPFVLMLFWPLESNPLIPNRASPFSTLVLPPPPLPLFPRCLMPFSRSPCLELPPLLRGASETDLGDLRCPWLEAEVESSRGWVFFKDPFLRFLRVREIQTSPTDSLVHGNSKSWVVLSGQHEDHPWPKTKKGYSTNTSTLTWRGERKVQFSSAGELEALFLINVYFYFPL